MKHAHSQDPRYAGIKVLFLGLFDVTRSAAEMGDLGISCLALFGHCLALF